MNPQAVGTQRQTCESCCALYSVLSTDSRQINKWLGVVARSVKWNQASRGAREKGTRVYMSRVASEELASSLNEVTVRAGRKLRGSFWGLGRTCANTMGHQWAWLLFLVRACECELKEASSRHGMRSLEPWGRLWMQFETRWENTGGFRAGDRSRARSRGLKMDMTLPIEATGTLSWGTVRKPPTPPYKLRWPNTAPSHQSPTWGTN